MTLKLQGNCTRVKRSDSDTTRHQSDARQSNVCKGPAMGSRPGLRCVGPEHPSGTGLRGESKNLVIIGCSSVHREVSRPKSETSCVDDHHEEGSKHQYRYDDYPGASWQSCNQHNDNEWTKCHKKHVSEDYLSLHCRCLMSVSKHESIRATKPNTPSVPPPAAIGPAATKR